MSPQIESRSDFMPILQELKIQCEGLLLIQWELISTTQKKNTMGIDFISIKSKLSQTQLIPTIIGN